MFLYHVTDAETIQTILREGLIPAGLTSRIKEERDLTAAAEKNGISLPIKRQDCVFCYILFHEVVEALRLDRKIYQKIDQNSKPSGAVVIDAEGIKDQLYIADFNYFSDMIDLKQMKTPNDVVRSESYEDALINYANSVTPVTEYESVADIDGEHRITEVLIEDGISASRIEEVIFFEEVDAEGYTSSYPVPPIS